MDEKELYKKMYYTIFNSVTDALKMICKGEPDRAAELLIKAQQRTEEIFMDAGE